MHLPDLFIHATAALGVVADYNGKKQGVGYLTPLKNTVSSLT